MAIYSSGMDYKIEWPENVTVATGQTVTYSVGLIDAQGNVVMPDPTAPVQYQTSLVPTMPTTTELPRWNPKPMTLPNGRIPDPDLVEAVRYEVYQEYVQELRKVEAKYNARIREIQEWYENVAVKRYGMGWQNYYGISGRNYD